MKLNVLFIPESILLLFFLTLSCQSVGQKLIIHQLLTESLNNRNIESFNQHLSNISSLNYNLPFVEKIELRTETERLLTSRQEFLFRSSFNGLDQRKKENLKFKALISWKSYDLVKFRNSLLSDCYSDILDIVFVSEKIALSNRFLDFFAEKEKMTELILIRGNSADLMDLVKVKEDIVQEKIRIQEQTNELKTLLSKREVFKSMVPGFDSIIGIDQIISFVSSLVPDFNNHWILQEYNFENEYLSAVLAKEKAESAKIVDFFQMKYTVRDDLLLQNRFSVGMGFAIPWKGSSRLKQQDVIIKQQTRNADRVVEKLKLEEKFGKARTDLFSTFENYKMFLLLRDDPDMIKLKEKIKASGRVEPLKLLDFKKSELETAAKLIDLKHKIFKSYIEVLESSGVLCGLPYRNYFHPLFPVLL